MKNVIACEVLEKEINLIKDRHNLELNIILLDQGLHDEPKKLREELQAEIDKIPSGEEICLVFGLCGDGISGIKSGSHFLKIAKVHDCFSIFLGGKSVYDGIVAESKGTYFYTPSWIDKAKLPSEKRFSELYEKYVEDFGEDNAEYLIEMEKASLKAYESLMYIYWNEFDGEGYRAFSKECADYLGIKYKEYKGSDRLLEKLLVNPDQTDILTVPPNSEISPTYDKEVISFKECV